jgi:hypothetical protein
MSTIRGAPLLQWRKLRRNLGARQRNLPELPGNSWWWIPDGLRLEFYVRWIVAAAAPDGEHRRLGSSEQLGL